MPFIVRTPKTATLMPHYNFLLQKNKQKTQKTCYTLATSVQHGRMSKHSTLQSSGELL